MTEFKRLSFRIYHLILLIFELIEMETMYPFFPLTSFIHSNITNEMHPVGAQWSTHGWMAFHSMLMTHVFISPPVDGHLSCFQFGVIINTVLQIFWYLEQWSPIFLARDRFPRRQLFYGWGWGGWFGDDSSTLHLLCTLSLLLVHQLHLGSSGVRFWRLGTPVLEHMCRFFSVESIKCCAQKSF